MENKKIRVYFAHPIATYNTILEEYFIKWFEQVKAPHGYELVNPNNLDVAKDLVKIDAEARMDYFKSLVESCDELYALPFEDFILGSGVAKEMKWMYEKHGRVEVFPFFTVSRQLVYPEINTQFDVLSHQETREKMLGYNTGTYVPTPDKPKAEFKTEESWGYGGSEEYEEKPTNWMSGDYPGGIANV